MCTARCGWIIHTPSDSIGSSDGMDGIPPFFCTATEMDRDVSEDLVAQPLGYFSSHSLEEYMFPPSCRLDDTLASVYTNFLHVMEIYVDKFCTMVQMDDVGKLHHVSQLLLQFTSYSCSLLYQD